MGSVWVDASAFLSQICRWQQFMTPELTDVKLAFSQKPEEKC